MLWINKVIVQYLLGTKLFCLLLRSFEVFILPNVGLEKHRSVFAGQKSQDVSLGNFVKPILTVEELMQLWTSS